MGFTEPRKAVEEVFEQAKVICHGHWTDVVKGRTLTSYPTLQP